MLILLLDIDPASKRIIMDTLDTMDIQDMRLEDRMYSPDLLKQLRDIDPDIILFDVSHTINCFEVSVDLFAAAPCASVMLIGSTRVEYNKDPVIYMPFKQYIQKPLRADMLKKAIEEVLPNIPESKELWKIPLNDEPMQDLLSVMEYRYLLARIFNDDMEAGDIQKAKELLGIERDKTRYMRVFVAQSKNEEEDALPYNFGLFAFMKRRIQCKHIISCEEPTKLAGIISTSTEENIPEGSVEWYTLRRWIQDETLIPQSLFISFSPCFTEMENIPYAHRCAKTGLGKAFFMGYRDITINAIPEPRREFLDVTLRERQFGDLLYNQENKEAALAYLDATYEEMKELDINYIRSIRRLYAYYIANVEYRKLKFSNKKIIREQVAEDARCFADSAVTLRELHQHMIKITVEYFEGELSTVSTSQSNTIRVLECIRKYYNNPDISLQFIADHIYLSPTHLAADFKKEMGMSIGKYITQYRIKQAKYLLENPVNKIGDIAQLIGFRDAHHFSKTFRKMEGVAPTKYH